MAVASARTGTPPPGRVWRSLARSSSRKVISGMIATATEENRAVTASVRLSATVLVPADSSRAAAWVPSRGGAVSREPGEEVVEAGEVPVQDTLGAAHLIGDRAAGQRVWPLAEQHALGCVEQLPAGVAEVHPGRQPRFPNQ